MAQYCAICDAVTNCTDNCIPCLREEELEMGKEAPNVIIGIPYPIAAGAEYGYRVFDGKEWHDCDKNGKVKKGRN